MNKSNNIQDKKSGFKVPENYFDSLENSVLDQIKSKEISKKTGFKTPQNYFSEFTVKLPVEKEETKVIALNSWTKWVAAASIIAVSILGALYIDSISPKKSLQFSDLDNDMIEQYFEYNLDSQDELIDLENTSIKGNLDTNISKLNDQDIIEYLNDKLDEQDYDEEN
jgi:hypothetical protein